MSFIDNWKEWSKTKKILSIVVVCCIGVIIIGALAGGLSPDKNTSTSVDDTSKSASSPLQVRITTDDSWSGSIMVGSSSSTYDGQGSETIDLNGSSFDIVSVSIQKQSASGDMKVEIIKDGKVVKEQSTSAAYGVVAMATS